MATFDLTFDRTFQDYVASPENPTAPDVCRKSGAYMAWLTKTGWFYWLFEGKISRGIKTQTETEVKRAGSIQRRKEVAETYTIRTANLLEEESDVVSSIYSSSAVFLMPVNKDNKFLKIPVDIEDGTLGVWQSNQKRGTLEVSFTFPSTKMQRI